MQHTVISSLPSETDAVVEAKRQLRRQMRRTRRNIAQAERVRAARDAAAHLRRLAESSRRRVAALYAGTLGELCTEAAAAELQDAGIALAYPRILQAERRLVFHRVGEPSSLRQGALGIPEPSSSLPRTPIEQIDLFVVPGLAFDATGSRLGWGQGYYDRILAHHRHALRVGYAFEAQIVSATPKTARDIPMDHIVSEQGIVDCRPHPAPAGRP